MTNILLVDVDGVAADLMLGFDRWLDEKHGERIPKELITHFNIPTSPALAELHRRVDLGTALGRFLAEPNVYETYVDPIAGSVEGLAELRKIVDVVFLTATLKEAPESYVSKFNWCREKFGDIPMIAAPSKYKHLVGGRWGVDDRFDTCQRFKEAGVKPMLFGQPWNEAPEHIERYDWPTIVAKVKDEIDRWP